MAQTPEFKYAPMFQLGKDDTEYYLLTKDYVSTANFEGQEILKIEKEGLAKLIEQAFTDVNFKLRRAHNECVANILKDPESSDNDKYVALTMLRNACQSARTQVRLSSMEKKVKEYGPITPMKSRSVRVFTTPT